MANSIPLIRAMSLLPALRWLRVNRLPVEESLRSVGFSPDQLTDPFRPVPLAQVGAFLRAICARYRENLPVRIVSEADVREIALLGMVAIGTKSPREALLRISGALPVFCSHEQVSWEANGDTTVVRQFYTETFDDETQHYFHQYVAAMLSKLCEMTGAAFPRLTLVELTPHPQVGLEHIQGRLAVNLIASRSRVVTMTVSNRTLDRPFTLNGRDRMAKGQLPTLGPLIGDGSLGGSVELLLKSMVREGEAISMRGLALSAGRSMRTLQRQLRSEGVTFSELLEKSRREEAIRMLSEADESIADVSAHVGYSEQASLTRAFRRWTGETPRTFRGRKKSR